MVDFIKFWLPIGVDSGSRPIGSPNVWTWVTSRGLKILNVTLPQERAFCTLKNITIEVDWEIFICIQFRENIDVCRGSRWKAPGLKPKLTLPNFSPGSFCKGAFHLLPFIGTIKVHFVPLLMTFFMVLLNLRTKHVYKNHNKWISSFFWWYFLWFF